MSILIHGVSLPKNGLARNISIFDDGCVIYYRGSRVIGSAVELPPHGRLIDADAFLARNAYFADREFVNPKYDDTLKDLIDGADTVLPADHSADTGKMINDDPEYKELLDSRVVQALEHGFYATMYGEVYKPDRPIIFIKSDEASWNPKLGGICFIWGYPGPDISIYRPEQYGITWALTEHELKGYCAAGPKKEDDLK